MQLKKVFYGLSKSPRKYTLEKSVGSSNEYLIDWFLTEVGYFFFQRSNNFHKGNMKTSHVFCGTDLLFSKKCSSAKRMHLLCKKRQLFNRCDIKRNRTVSFVAKINQMKNVRSTQLDPDTTAREKNTFRDPAFLSLFSAFEFFVLEFYAASL